jgi:hypothetical protein
MSHKAILFTFVTQLLLAMVFASEPLTFMPQVGIWHLVFSNPNNVSLDKPIMIDGVTGDHMTYGQLKSGSLKFRAGLHKFGFRKGDTVCIFSQNKVRKVFIYLLLLKGYDFSVFTVPSCHFFCLSSRLTTLWFVSVRSPQLVPSLSPIQHTLPKSCTISLSKPMQKSSLPVRKLCPSLSKPPSLLVLLNPTYLFLVIARSMESNPTARFSLLIKRWRLFISPMKRLAKLSLIFVSAVVPQVKCDFDFHYF